MEEKHTQEKKYTQFRLKSLIAGFQEKKYTQFRLKSLIASFQEKKYTRFKLRSLAAGLLAAALLVTSSVALAAQGSTVTSGSFLQGSGPNPHYVPSSAFGDTDDLPASMRTAKRLVLPAGSSTVSGVVTDATTGLPVANAQVGISVGTVSSAAQYATTASNGSYSFTGIASGTYNLEADRYTISGTQPFYKDAQQMQVNVSSNSTVNFSLTPIAVPGSRTVPGGRAKNMIIVDFDETFYESWFSDTKSMVNKSPNTHQLAQAGVVGTNDWTQYGWSPIDHYQIAVGSYPAWRSPDAPAQAWGQTDGLDTNLWYNGSEVFGQESIFDVAKSYGMSTGVIGGDDYPTGHITDANVDQISLGSNINGVPTLWDTEVENFITSHASNPNGFLIYMPVTEAEGSSIEGTSPDDSSSSGLYQQASTWDDEAFGTLLTWLQQNNYMSNTDLSITSDEAENDHTSFDNFYGLGSTGQGTTRHDPFVLEGPGVVSGQTYTTNMGIDDLPTNYMYALGLPSPVDSRGHVIPSLFTPGGTPTPTPTPPPSPTPTPPPSPTPTPPPSPTPTPPPSPTPTPPSPTPTPPPTNLIQNGGFETSGSWTFGGTPLPVISTTQAHSGSHSLLVGGTSGQQTDSTATQLVTIPGSATQAALSFWYWPASNDSSTYGWQSANVVNSSGQVLQQLFQTTVNNRVWTQLTFDLSAYAGQTVGIQFLDHENAGTGSYYTYMYVDDVSLSTNGSVSTPPPSPTPTPPPTNLIQNGGYETSGSWTFGGTPLPVISTTQAHSGSHSLLVGGTSGQQTNSTASQSVTIPSSATQATLSFWYWPASNDSSTYGWQEANVVNSSGQVLQQLFQTTANNRTWTQLTFNLSAYAGQTVSIQFLDYENAGTGSYYTYMYVDDVALNVN